MVINRLGKTVHTGSTPASVTLKSHAGYFKGESYTIRFSKEGFASKDFTLRSTVDGWYFGNILFGGIIGMLIVDPLIGAMYNLPNDVEVDLAPSVSSRTDGHEFTVATLDSLTPEQVARLEKIN